MLHAKTIDIDHEAGSDGYYMVTIWTEEIVPYYIAICRDLDGSSPDRIWLEWEDQITGHYIDSLSFTIVGSVLQLDIIGAQAFSIPIPAEIGNRFSNGVIQLDVSLLNASVIERALQIMTSPLTSIPSVNGE